MQEDGKLEARLSFTEKPYLMTNICTHITFYFRVFGGTD